MACASDDAEAGLDGAHPGQTSATTVSKPLSTVIVLLFPDVEGSEINVPFHREMYIWDVGACGRGKGEVIGNNSEGCVMVTP